MNWNLAAPVMLWGLVGVSIPVIIHLLSRRRATVIDWGAMQFLDIGRRAQRKFQITELLLMAGRMALLALVALAVARPFFTPKAASGGAGALAALPVGASLGGTPRDVVLVLDGSESMARSAGGTSPRKEAVTWSREFLKRLPSGSSVAILDARDRVLPIVAPPSFDKQALGKALSDAPAPRGSSDLAASVSEALRVLESTKNTERDVVILTDGQREAWRPGETARWDLLRALHAQERRQTGITPRIWALNVGTGAKPEGADGSVAPLELTRGLVPSGLPIRIETAIANAGPEPLTRTAELLVDGVPVPGSTQTIGPVPSGSKTPARFTTTIAVPGAHTLTVRLDPADDPLPVNDEASVPVEIAEALPVLLVDGEPGVEPLESETAFLRAALAPSEDDTPAVRAAVISTDDLSADSLANAHVLVLANVESLDASQSGAVADFVARGGGVLVLPGGRVDEDVYNKTLFRDGDGWLPASLGESKGDYRAREAVAHPSPRTFSGPVMEPFGRGESPPLGRAGLFEYRVLEPASKPSAAVLARLDTGDPWLIERPFGRGRVIVAAGPLDAEGGTLPVNPDFVPWLHTMVFHLADPSASTEPLKPGETIRLELAEAPEESVKQVRVDLPDGRKAQAAVIRKGGRASVEFSGTSEPGIYRIHRSEPQGGIALSLVQGDGRESDPKALDPEEARALSKGWPLEFETDPARLAVRLLDPKGAGPRPVWRWLVLAALGGLCVEVLATRQVVKSRGLTGGEDA